MSKKPNPHARKIAAERRKHASKVGELMIAWNELHFVLQTLYAILAATKGNLAPPAERWAKQGSDYRQRGMLLDKAKVKLKKNPGALAEIRWVVGWTDTLALIRNAFVHLYVGYKITPPQVKLELSPGIFGNPKYDVVKKNPDRAYKTARRDFRYLMTHAMNVMFQSKGFVELPKRPTIKALELDSTLTPRVRR